MSHRAAASIVNQRKRELHRALSHTVLVARADVTTTVILGPTDGSSGSGSGSTSVPWAAIAGGLAAGIIIVIVAIVFWRCWAKEGHRKERERTKSEDQFEPVEWRPEHSFSPPTQMKSAPHRHHHQRIPSSPSKPKPKPSPLSSPSPRSPQQRSVNPNVDLRASNVSGSPSSDERNRRTGEGKDLFHLSDDDKGRRGSVSPEDSGYKVSTVPYHGPSSDGAKTVSPSEDEDKGSRNLKDNAHPPSSPPSLQHKPPRRSSSNEARRGAPTPPASLTATGPRRYAPARPSPLAQASYRDSTLSPSSSPLPPSPRAEKQLQQEHPPQHAHSIDHPLPPLSPRENPSDPFLEPSQQQQPYYYPQHHDYHYEGEGESDRPASGVGYAI